MFKVCIFSCVLGLALTASLKSGPKELCPFKSEYCDTRGADYDVFILSDENMDDTEECSNQCFAEKDLAKPQKPCLGFTMRTVRGHSECQLLRAPCVKTKRMLALPVELAHQVQHTVVELLGSSCAFFTLKEILTMYLYFCLV